MGLKIGFIGSILGTVVAEPIRIGLNMVCLTHCLIQILYSKKDKFILENEIIFEIIEAKMQKEIIKNFEYKIPKAKITIYNDENFKENIKEIKNILLKRNYIESLKKIVKNNFNVLLVGFTGVGKSTLINEFLQLDKDKRAKESVGIPTKTEDFIPYKGKNNNINYTLHDTNGITYTGEDSIEKK